MATVPPPELVKLWTQEADKLFWQGLLGREIHPVLIGPSHTAYCQGYMKAKFQQWIDDTKIESFSRELHQELGD